MDETNVNTKKSLTPTEKEAIYLLSTGTFLEYFDLMLYVHLLATLNSLFFPATPIWQSPIGKAFAFCSTYLLRPVGGVIFGLIGDKLGRRVVVIITTMLMAIACCTISLLPTYAQIGLLATYILTLCRMVQGVSAAGEIVASEVYLTELIDYPFKAPAVSMMAVSCLAGGVCALVLASFAAGNEFVLRASFMLGAIIALIGARARLSLKESRIFADAARRRIANAKPSIQSTIYSKSDFTKTVASFFVMQATWSSCFYFALIYSGEIMAAKFGYSLSQVAKHNLIVTSIQLVAYLGLATAGYYFHPLKVLKCRIYVFAGFVLLSPYIFYKLSTPLHMMLVQLVILISSSTDTPASPVVYSHMPILKRLRSATITQGASRLLMYIASSFGLVYLSRYFPNCGFAILMVPLTTCVLLAIRHLENMENKVHLLRGTTGKGIS